MRWAVFGNQGMFGLELKNRLLSFGHEVAGFNRGIFDIETPEHEIALLIKDVDVVVNAIGYTAVDQAEDELFEANRVNAIFAGRLAQACEIAGVKIFHISTDYVFDGLATDPYLVSSLTNPLTVYGQSKLLGEQLVFDSGANFTIFRTAWLYSAFGRNFPKSIVAQLKTRKELSVVYDQIGSPTWASDLADVLIDHATRGLAEPIVHAVSSGRTSWHGFALAIRDFFPEYRSRTINALESIERPTPAKRPAWSVLENSQTEGLVIGDWQERWEVAAPIVLKEFLGEQA
jgi:dTDP-4-dehydrorhamnose reductase